MKKGIIILFATISLCFVSVSAQHDFKTGSGNISFPGDLVYEGVERDLNAGDVWAKGYTAIEGDSVSFTKIVLIADKSIEYYCYRYITSLKDVYMLDSVSTLDHVGMSNPKHLFMVWGKAAGNKRTQAVHCREYGRYDIGVVKRYMDYTLLFVYSNRKAADEFYQKLLKLVGKGKE